MPARFGRRHILFLDDLIRMYIDRLYPGFEVGESYAVKMTRDAELYLGDEYAGDFVRLIQVLYHRNEPNPVSEPVSAMMGRLLMSFTNML